MLELVIIGFVLTLLALYAVGQAAERVYWRWHYRAEYRLCKRLRERLEEGGFDGR